MRVITPGTTQSEQYANILKVNNIHFPSKYLTHSGNKYKTNVSIPFQSKICQ